jgi:hypothetical protein
LLSLLLLGYRLLGSCLNVAQWIFARLCLLAFFLGRVTELAGSNAGSLAHGFVNAILDQDGQFNSNTLSILDDLAVAEDGVDFCSGDFLRVGTQSSETLLLLNGVCAR